MIFFIFKKVFKVNLKSAKNVFYALKIFEKLEFTDFEESIFTFKKIGLLSKECRFIVETIATFQNSVSVFLILIFNLFYKKVI